MGNIGLLIVQFLLVFLLSAVLFAQGDKAAELICSFSRRLAGDRGETAAMLSAAAIRSVALGVVGTAIIQSTPGGFGLLVTGIPAASILIAVLIRGFTAGRFGAEPHPFLEEPHLILPAQTRSLIAHGTEQAAVSPVLGHPDRRPRSGIFDRIGEEIVQCHGRTGSCNQPAVDEAVRWLTESRISSTTWPKPSCQVRTCGLGCFARDQRRRSRVAVVTVS